jgi:hypothetical protein
MGWKRTVATREGKGRILPNRCTWTLNPPCFNFSGQSPDLQKKELGPKREAIPLRHTDLLDGIGDLRSTRQPRYLA